MEASQMAITRTYTAADLFDIEGDERYELVDGELHLVTGSAHSSSAIGLNIGAEIRFYLKRHRIGIASGEASGFILARNPDTVLVPDAAFIRNEKLIDGQAYGRHAPYPPDLAVEVMSPSDRRIDLDRKVQRYLTAGTSIVWLVEPDAKTVTVYRANRSPKVFGIGESLSGEDVLPGFELDMTDVFE